MLTVRDLRFAYNGRPVLDDVSFEAAPGSCLAVLGNNGAGKSTLVKCLNRVLEPRGGEALLFGRRVSGLPRADIARRFAYVAQEVEPARLTVFDAVMLGRRPYIRFMPSAEDFRVVGDIIEKLELQDFALRHLDELSGGEAQKVMLARALAQEPEVLLLDEPTSKLDLRKQHEILALVRDIAVSRNICVVLVIHDLNLALRYCDRFLLLRNGRVLAHGGTEVMTPENIGEIYQMPVTIESVRGFRVVVPVPA